MNWNHLFSQLPVATLIGWMLSVGIPYLSAVFSRQPSHWTGVCTALLSLLDGVLVELAHQGTNHYNLAAAAGPAFLAWLTATKWHSKVLSGTPTEDKLYALPRLRLERRTPPTPPTQAAA